MNIPIIILLSVETLLLILCIIVIIIYVIKFKRYEEKYKNIWSKFYNENFEYDVENLVHNITETRKISEEAKICSESVEGKMLKSIQKVGIVKYDAYDGGKNALSFALAMLNSKDDGILINSVYTRNGSNLYAKQIIDGEYEGNLSNEEEEALNKAKKSKSFI